MDLYVDGKKANGDQLKKVVLMVPKCVMGPVK